MHRVICVGDTAHACLCRVALSWGTHTPCVQSHWTDTVQSVMTESSMGQFMSLARHSVTMVCNFGISNAGGQIETGMPIHVLCDIFVRVKLQGNAHNNMHGQGGDGKLPMLKKSKAVDNTRGRGGPAKQLWHVRKLVNGGPRPNEPWQHCRRTITTIAEPSLTSREATSPRPRRAMKHPVWGAWWLACARQG